MRSTSMHVIDSYKNNFSWDQLKGDQPYLDQLFEESIQLPKLTLGMIDLCRAN